MVGIFDRIKKAFTGKTVNKDYSSSTKPDTFISSGTPINKTIVPPAPLPITLPPGTAPAKPGPVQDVAPVVEPLAPSTGSNSRNRGAPTSQLRPEERANIGLPPQEPLAAPTGPVSQLGAQGRANVGLEQNTPESLQAEGYELTRAEDPVTKSSFYVKDGIDYVLQNGNLEVVGEPVTGSGGLAAIGGLGAVGVKAGARGIAGIINRLKGLKNSREAVKILSNADVAGNRVFNIGGLAKAGSKFKEAGQVITNNKQAGLINKAIISAAQKVSNNWKTLLGWGVGTGTATALASASLWSGFGVRNSYSDGQQQIGIMVANAYKNGNIELGDQLQELADDRTALYEELNPIWSNPKIAGEQIIVFKDTVKEANALVREKALVEQDEQDQITELQQKVLDGSITPEEQQVLDELSNDSNDFQANKDFTDELKRQAGDAINARDREFMEMIISGEMTAEQWINNPDVIAFVNDSNNDFSATTDTFKKLQTRIATGLGDSTGSGNGGGFEIEPPSTLGFGLLQTGTEKVSNEGEGDDLIESQELSIEDRALELFGLRYDQLTEAQKEQLRG